MKQTHKLTPEIRDQIPSWYRCGETITQIATRLKITDQAVYGILKRRDEPRRSMSESHQRYTCDFNFFETIDAEAKAYWLGFLAADGHISVRKRSAAVLVLALGIQDASHVFAFKRAIQSTHPIKNYRHKCSRHGFHLSARLCVTSNKMIADLKLLGINSQKRKRLAFPSVPQRLLSHFMRGYFDGDGSITTPSARNPIFSVVGYHAFISQYQTVLISTCGVNPVKFGWRLGTPNLAYCGIHQIRRIRSFLYRDATIYLRRKHKRFFAYN